MVRGLDTFRDFFKGFEDNYILIGGAACDIHEEMNAQVPRATKDLDIILIVEALSVEFVQRFWEFIKLGGYITRQKGENSNKHEYYRFLKPEKVEFPVQIELCSRRLENLNLMADTRLTPIPMDDDLSSLSAVLLDDDYYNYVLKYSSIEEGVHLANIESLICLKARAYIDLSERKSLGENIDTKNIRKHKNDIFRLVTMLPAAARYTLPEKLRVDI